MPMLAKPVYAHPGHLLSEVYFSSTFCCFVGEMARQCVSGGESVVMPALSLVPVLSVLWDHTSWSRFVHSEAVMFHCGIRVQAAELLEPHLGHMGSTVIEHGARGLQGSNFSHWAPLTPNVKRLRSSNNKKVSPRFRTRLPMLCNFNM